MWAHHHLWNINLSTSKSGSTRLNTRALEALLPSPVLTWLCVYVVYQVEESSVRRAELLSERLASPVLYVLDPDPLLNSTSTDENLRVHHGPCAGQQRTQMSIHYLVYRHCFYFVFYGNTFDTGRLTNRWSRTYVEHRGRAEKSLSPQLLTVEVCPANTIQYGQTDRFN